MRTITWAGLALFTLLASACAAAPPAPGALIDVSQASGAPALPTAAAAGPALLLSEPPPSDAEREFTTDFSRHTVPYEEILSGGPPKDGIPAIDDPKFVTVTEAGEWLKGLEPVVLVQVGNDARAYPLQILIWHEIVNDTVGGQPVAVFWAPGVASALDSSAIALGRDVGTAVAFSSQVDGQRLTFRAKGERIVDAETGSEWDLLGRAVMGELAGHQLAPVVSVNHFWFSWAAFKPGTRVYHSRQDR